MSVQIKIASHPEDFKQAFHLRWLMLRKPWDQPEGSEQDELEAQSITVVAFEHNQAVGTGRVHLAGNEVAQIRYMAVADAVQGRGVGKQILAQLEKEIHKRGAKKVFLNSRENAVKFYLANGYRMVREAEVLYGVIRHFLMEKDLG